MQVFPGAHISTAKLKPILRILLVLEIYRIVLATFETLKRILMFLCSLYVFWKRGHVTIF